MQPVLISGVWTAADADAPSFHAWNPSTGAPLTDRFPISSGADLDRMGSAAEAASDALASVDPDLIRDFLLGCAEAIEARRSEIARTAHLETGLPIEPRLAQVEFDRMIGQLRTAADAAADTSATGWRRPLSDGPSDIRSDRGPLGGAVLTIGPNNFPLAFHAVAGGDFAAAIAAGNPVIAKGHPLHPGTGLLLAQCVAEALQASALPPATVQYFHHCTPEDGARLVRHHGVAAVGFTGGREAGLGIKRVADDVGKPAYLEMSSTNPVFASMHADSEEVEVLTDAWVDSITLGGGQFCTKPGLLIVIGRQTADRIASLAEARLRTCDPGLLFSESGRDDFIAGVGACESAGATRRCGGASVEPGWRVEPTLLEVDGEDARRSWSVLSREVFGPLGMMVRVEEMSTAIELARMLEGQLTATLWGDPACESAWRPLLRVLRPKCGRLLERKMPTGVAVVPTMVHGGPFPATAHAGYTSVGLPASIERFTHARCWDGVSASLRPSWLR